MSTTSVLVVEDEAIVAEDIREMVTSLGYTSVGPCPTGESAVEFAQAQPVDVALMDIHLAGKMDGIDAAHELSKRGVGIVFLTAYADEATLARAKLTTPYGYIVKPFDARDVRSALEVATYKRSVEAALERHRQLLASTLTTVDDAILTLGDKGQVLLLNPAASTLLGVEPGAVEDRPLHEVARLVARDGAPISDELEQASRIGQSTRLEAGVRLETSDAPPVPVDGMLSIVRDAQQRPNGAVLVLRKAHQGGGSSRPVDAEKRDAMLRRLRMLV